MTIRQDYLTLLEELVAIPSVSAQAASLPEAATTIANAFRQLGAKVTYDDTYFAPFVQAEFTSDQPDAKTLVIYNHYDVQPPNPLTCGRRRLGHCQHGMVSYMAAVLTTIKAI